MYTSLKRMSLAAMAAMLLPAAWASGAMIANFEPGTGSPAYADASGGDLQLKNYDGWKSNVAANVLLTASDPLAGLQSMRVQDGAYGYHTIGGQGYADGAQISLLMRIDHGYGRFQVRTKPGASYLTIADVTETGYKKWTINTSSSADAFGTATAGDKYQVTLTLDFTHQTGLFEAVNLTNTAEAPSVSSFDFKNTVTAADMESTGEFLGSSGGSGYIMSFDNLAVTVPEPASAFLSLVMLGGLMVKRRRE